jgi:D-serine deaminase-like pyridoxal phosphate-dependent protein
VSEKIAQKLSYLLNKRLLNLSIIDDQVEVIDQLDALVRDGSNKRVMIQVDVQKCGISVDGIRKLQSFLREDNSHLLNEIAEIDAKLEIINNMLFKNEG